MSLHQRRKAERDAKALRTAAEKAAGAKRVKLTMAEGLIEPVAAEFGPRWIGKFKLDSSHEDVRLWTVSCTIVPYEPPVVELFMEFPTPQLRATIALISQ